MDDIETIEIDEILTHLSIQGKAELLRKLLGPLAEDLMTHREATFYFCHIARGATYKDIAQEFGCAIRTVFYDISNAKKKLRKGRQNGL